MKIILIFIFFFHVDNTFPVWYNIIIKEVIRISINDRIKIVRKSLNLSQPEFGKRIGVSRDVIANIERTTGTVTPNEILLQHICSVYNVDPIWLETGEGEMFHKPDDRERFVALAAKIQSDPNPFKKRVFYALSLMSDEGWAAFQQAWEESEQKEKDTK